MVGKWLVWFQAAEDRSEEDRGLAVLRAADEQGRDVALLNGQSNVPVPT
jgi:hypothetical protein